MNRSVLFTGRMMKKINILIIGFFPQTTKNRIREVFPQEWSVCFASPEDYEEALCDTDIVIPEHVKINGAFLDQAPKLKLVQTGAGYDNVDLEACTKRGIVVCNASGINAGAVAEHVMALILGWYKNIPYLDSFMKAHRDERELDYTGGELDGKTVGLIGTGAIGQRVATRCSAFGMKVLGYNRRNISFPGIEAVSFEELLHRSDIISVHVPLTQETLGMISTAEFERMKTTALLINTSRGAVLDEIALTEALKDGKIAGACLDVYTEEPLAKDSPLRDMKNVILTPHTAGLPDGVKFHINRYRFFRSNFEKLISGQLPEHALNATALITKEQDRD